MNGSTTSGERRSIRTLLLSPWGIAAVLIGIFLLAEGYLAWRDRAIQVALESYAPFTTPTFELQFSKKFPYDPHSFIGRGARAGLWQWTPESLVLTEQGRQFFADSEGMFVSRAPAGKRRIKRMRTNQPVDGERQVEFLYEWSEVSPPAAVLPVPPPRVGEEYPGVAILAREAGSWRVKSLRARDFDEPMAHLRDIASGVLK